MHSKFPWVVHPHTPTAVFDADGKRIVDQWVAPDGWRPIETAPKDGSEILVWRPHEDSDHPAHIGIDLWKMYHSKGVWWRSRPGQRPTHWQPLPAPLSDKPAETAADNAALIAAIPGMVEAAEAIIKRMTSTFKAGNGRSVGIQADDGEKCWIVHSDEITALEAVLASIGRVK